MRHRVTLLLFALIVVYLSRQMLRNKVSSSFLAQVYLATILVFAGLYSATYKLNVSCHLVCISLLCTSYGQYLQFFFKFL